MDNLYVFAYGSLINLKSAELTLLRKINAQTTIKAYLHGHIRNWSVVDEVYSEQLNKTINAVFWGLTTQKDMKTNGLLIPISKKEIPLLDNREKNYDRVDVTKYIEHFNLIEKNASVITYLSQDSYNPSKFNSVYILNEYQKKVEDGCRKQGESFLNEFITLSEGNQNFQSLDGKYSFNRSFNS